MNLLKAVSSVVVLCSVAIFADMIDDLEDGNNQNETGYYWYYYTDAADGGTSEVTNAQKDVAGKMVMVPTANTGHGGGYAAECSWKFGADKPIGCSGECPYGQMVGMGTMLAPEGKTATWAENATTIKFWAKASVSFKLTVEVATSSVKDAGYHMKNIQVTTAWTQYSIPLADITQPTWAEEVVLDPADMTKIQFKVSADNSNTPNSGTFFIDDIEIDDSIPPFGICTSCVVKPDTPVGYRRILMADFEGEANLTASKFKGMYWYVYSDSKDSATTKSTFTAGTAINENDGTDKLIIEAGNINGYNNTQGLRIGFKLGDSYVQDKQIVKPFVGIGCMLSNSDKVAAGTAATLTCADASIVNGFYFDYKTEVADIKFKGLTVEFYDCDTGPRGLPFYTNIPPSGGFWRGVVIPLDKLTPPEFPDSIASTNTVQLKLNRSKLDKMQIKIQGTPGLTGMVSFDNFKFVDYVSVKHTENKSKDVSVISRIKTNRLIVSLKSLPTGNHTGAAELIGINGRVVAKEKVSANGTGFVIINTDKLAKGIYMLRINMNSTGNRNYSFCDRVTIN